MTTTRRSTLSRPFSRRTKTHQPTEKRRRLFFESLEDRRLLAVLYVDNSPGSENTEFTVTGGSHLNQGGLTLGSNLFTTIGAAVAAAADGDTINVADGTYPEFVVVDKSLTILGNQFGVDARTGRGANETIIDGSGLAGIVRVFGDGITVTIDGFTLESDSSISVTSGGFGAAITTVQSANLAGLNISNNIIQDASIGIAPQGDGALIQYNLIQNITIPGPAAGTGIYTDFGLSNSTIDNNKLVNLNNAGININSAVGTGNIISNNEIVSSAGSGIYLHGQSNTQVTGNTINNAAGAGGGITLGGNQSGIAITNNEVLGVGAGQSALRLRNDAGGPNSGLTITGNKFTAGAGPFGVRPGAGSYTGTLTLTDNEISGATAAIFNDDAALDIDASQNYWGTSDPTAITISGAGATNVDFTPLIDNDDTAPATVGFQADHSSLTVHTLSTQTGSTGLIQEGINLVDASGTVNVAAGTYAELVNVNKTVDLLGVQEGIDARTRGVVAESIIDVTGLGAALSISASDVVVDGFTIEGQTGGYPGAALWMQPGTNGTEVRNNIVQNNMVGVFVANNSSVNQTVIEKNMFRNNTNPGASSGHAIYADQYTAGSGAENVLIDNNKFTNTTLVGSSWALGISNTDATAFADITFSNNEVTNHGRGMYFFGTAGATISGNTINGTNSYAVGILDGGGGSADNSDIDITNNVLVGNTLRAIRVTTASYTGPLDISGNSITGGNIALDIAGVSTVNLTDNTITGNTTGGTLTNVTTVNLDTNASNNIVRVNVDGSNLISVGQFSVDGQVQSISYSGVTTLDVDTLGGNDTVKVAPHDTTLIDLDGGPHTVGDNLEYFSDGVNAFNIGLAVITTATKANINHANFENISVSGNLVLDGTGDDDTLEITATNVNSGSYVLTSNGVAAPPVAFSGITSLTFNGLEGHDILRINNPSGVFAPTGGVVFHGGANTTTSGQNPGGDRLEILGGAATSVEHRLANASDGAVRYNGSGTDNITYTGLEPVTDTIVAGARVFTFLAAAETITLSNAVAAGQSLIDSTLGESITFANPTTSLTINTTATAGGDTINIQGVDGAFNAALTITAKTTDAVTFQTAATNIGSGVLTTTAGSIAVNANVTTSGNASLTASTTNISATGTLAAYGLTAGAVSGIQLNTTVTNITATTSGAGNIDIDETDGANVLNVNASNGDADVSTTSGSLNVTTASASGTVTLTATAGAITDANGVTNNITATSLVASAATGIDLDTTVTNITATTSGTGSINIDEADGANVLNVDATTGDADVSTATGSLNVTTANASGTVYLTATAGAITDANGGSNNITAATLNASSAAGIDLDTTVGSITAAVTGTGDVRINEADAVTLVSVSTNNGTIEIDAGGTITATLVTAGGTGRNVRLATSSGGDLALGLVTAVGDTVLLRAAGAITDGNGASNNVNAASLAMTAGTGIGAGDAIETAVGTLAALAGAAVTDHIEVTNTGDLTIGSVTAFSTTVTGVTGGGHAIVTALSALTVAADVTMGGSVLLTAVDSVSGGDDLTVNSGVKVESTGSTVELRAGDDMTLEDCSTVRAATTITLRGDYGDADPGVGSTMTLLGTLDAADGNYNVLVYGGPDGDVITLNPGVSHTADSTWLDGGAGDDTYHIYTERLNGGAEAATIDDTGGGNDRATVYATDAAEDIYVLNNVDDQTLAQTGGYVDNQTTERIVRYTGALEYLTVRGEDGMDTFFVKPSQTTEITIHGGTPTFGPGGGDVPQVLPGDTLDFNSYDNTFLLICGTILTNDDLGINHQGASFQPVHYRNIENMPLTPLGTTTWRFDMDSTPAETQTGYTSVLPSTVYDADDPLSTHGWNAVMNGFDRGAGPFSSSFTDLLRDGHWHSASRTFTAEVEDGWYLVSIKTGDKSFARNQLRVTHGDTGQVLIDNLASPAGQIVDRAFVMLVQDGTLDLTFTNMGGDPYWVVNSIEIRPGEILTFGSPETDIPLIADGVTHTEILGYNATAGALITIDPQLDTQGNYLPEGTVTILGTDADPDVAGFQVVADGAGVFSYTIVRPSAAGTLRVLYTEVTGEQASCFSVDFVAPSIRRFDFNSGASSTQTPVAANGQNPADPGYTGVLPTELTSPVVGYGWVTAANGFDRGVLASPGYSDLLRDGAWESGPRDFRIQLPTGQDYDVTVTFGDAGFARDQMNVSVLTGSAVSGLANVTNVATAAGQQVHRSFVAAPNAQGELVLRFSDSGGDPYWTVSAVEVRAVYAPFTVSGPGGSLPANGTALDMFTVTGYTPNAWYTVSTDMGQVTTADGDPRYAGVQVQAPGVGAFEFTVQRGTGAGTANVRVEEVNGESRGSTTQVYVYNPLRQFDFNGSAVDTETAGGTWWSVRGSDLYDLAVGHGWNAAVSEFQRNAAGISEPQLDSLYRDGHWQSATRTFQVGVDPTKAYDVRIHTGDRSFARDQLQITIEGVVAPQSPVATAANEFDTITVTVPANTVGIDGILDIQIANLGGDPYWVINGIEVAENGGLPVLPEPDPDPPAAVTLRFDFNTASSPNASGFTSVGTTNAYNPTLGYGWQTTASTFSRSGPTDLLRDGHWGTNNTFNVNVPDGAYLVNVTLGDASFARNNISVWAEEPIVPAPRLSGLATAAGQFIHRSFPVTVSDGQLNVRIASTGGDPYFTINALEVFNVTQGNHGLASGDGINFAGTSTAPNGSLVTVATSLGSIATADADPSYAGVQVVVTGGAFSFVVTPPAGGGSATVTSEEVTGLAAGTTNYDYAVPAVRRFDFNGSANDTQVASPVFTGVRGNTLYNANNGYGWTQSVPEFQRATAARPSVALYRDGHYGSAARTFQVAAIEDTVYSVRVYVGDASFLRNNIQISVEGGAWQNVANTAANEFATLVVTGTSINDDGLLTISIRNNGGDPYWVINGMDVWIGAGDPGAADLLAGVWSGEMVGGQLTQAALDAVLPVAREYWVSTGLADWQVAELSRTPVAIGDLSYRGALGVAKPEGIWLDASGAGLGWSVGSGQWAVVSDSQATANGQLPTSAYDLLTVLTHELGHVLGYDDLDPQQHPDHIMAGVLQPGASRIATPAVDSGLTWTFGESASLLSLERPGRLPTVIGDRAVQRAAVDRVLDDLLRDDLRVSRDAWQRDEDEEFERLLTSRSSERHDETDDFFAQL